MDSFPEDKEPPYNSNNINGREDLLQLPVRYDKLDGLCYIDSQEPRDLSQADALNFVKMFIKKNGFVVFEHKVDHGRSILPLLLQRFHRPNPSLHLFLLGFASTRIDHPCSHPFQLLVLSPNSSAKPAPDNIDFSVFFVMKSNSAQ
ncbi:hypothetical protein LWI28_000438 [Acer negundo]|uniref:Uncharacterized protein n=1 Tax=Acer negundo TaxID=4023 RepID=A0AAD5I8K3_ACENE|nr:hypothetical protein LWI28_000438 [Acer negundo]